MIAQSEIKREETEPDQMPSFEMDSAHNQDRVKQEIQIVKMTSTGFCPPRRSITNSKMIKGTRKQQQQHQ